MKWANYVGGLNSFTCFSIYLSPYEFLLTDSNAGPFSSRNSSTGALINTMNASYQVLNILCETIANPTQCAYYDNAGAIQIFTGPDLTFIFGGVITSNSISDISWSESDSLFMSVKNRILAKMFVNGSFAW